MTESFTEPIKKAFDFASETTKQLLTLSTGIIALTITFAKDILVAVPLSAKVFLMIAWGLYVFSLLFGLMTLMALTGELQPPTRSGEETTGDERDAAGRSESQANATDLKARVPSIWARSITVASVLQISTFLLATLFVVITGVVSTINSGGAKVSHQKPPEAVKSVPLQSP